MDNNYNTTRAKLLMPEYGRHVQDMIEYVANIPDRKKRNEQIQAVVSVMGTLNPQLRDVVDFRHKLWDHVQIISDFKIDIDSPYPKPSKKEKDEKPQPLKYQNSNIRFRTYGTFLEQMIKKVSTMQEGEEKKNLTARIAQELKRSHLQWNINTCDEEVILKHLELLSDGKLKVEKDFHFKTTKEILSKPLQKNKVQQKKKKNNNGNNKQK